MVYYYPDWNRVPSPFDFINPHINQTPSVHPSELPPATPATKPMQAGGYKHDTGKLRMDLIPPECLAELARVFTIGASKYDDDNWRQGMDWNRVFAAMQRHANAWHKGETRDPEDGQLHLASVAWCAFVLMWYEMYGVGNDNRWVNGKQQNAEG